MRPDLDVVARMVPPDSRVLDLGCGDGSLLQHLARYRGCRVQGVEVSSEAFHECIARGVPVMHSDIDHGLPELADGAFDVAVLSQTLQATYRPAFVLSELTRVGRQGIVSFPNFGHIGIRAKLAMRGRMPTTRVLPEPWYETENIHLCTITDFERLCETRGIRLLERKLLDSRGRPQPRRGKRAPNLLAAAAVYRVDAPARTGA